MTRRNADCRPVRALLLLGATTVCGSARADGAFPASLSILVPVDRPHETTLATNFGLISSNDDCKTWTWICETDVTSGGFLYQVGPAPQDRLFALTGAGSLVYSDNRACGWSVASGAVAEGSVSDVFPDPTDAQHVVAIVSPNGVGNQKTYTLVESHDEGATFAVKFTAAPSDIITGVEIARSDPSTIYLTGYTGPNATPELLRSTDGGAGWQTTDLGAGLGASDASLIAVDPTIATRVFLRITTQAGEELAVFDAGTAARAPVSLPGGNLTAFARTLAGRILVAGAINKEAFLYRSIDAGMTFARVAGAPHLRALAERAGVLWGAADDFIDGFALATSMDDGDTWQRVMRYDQVSGINACVRASCRTGCLAEAALPIWPAAICGPGGGDASSGIGEHDASATTPPRARSGCGCNLAMQTDERGLPLSLLLLAAVWVGRRLDLPSRKRILFRWIDSKSSWLPSPSPGAEPAAVGPPMPGAARSGAKTAEQVSRKASMPGRSPRPTRGEASSATATTLAATTTARTSKRLPPRTAQLPVAKPLFRKREYREVDTATRFSSTRWRRGMCMRRYRTLRQA